MKSFVYTEQSEKSVEVSLIDEPSMRHVETHYIAVLSDLSTG